MILGKKELSFMGIPFFVVFRDNPAEGFGKDATAGVDGTKECLEVWFRGLLLNNTLVHECWHLFMYFMVKIHNQPKDFVELATDETYAYLFAELHSKLLETVTSFSAYRKLYDKEKGEKKNGKSI